MNVRPTIRNATEVDAASLLAIYAPYVERTAVSFETAVPTVEEFAGRITTAVAGWAWLVAEAQGECVGYAYAAPHRARPAYRWSVETSVSRGVHVPVIPRLAVSQSREKKGVSSFISPEWSSVFLCIMRNIIHP